LLLGFLLEQGIQAAVVWLKVNEVGDDTVAEERDFATTLVDVGRLGVLGIVMHIVMSPCAARNTSARRGETVIEIASAGRSRFVWATPPAFASPAHPCSESEGRRQRAEVPLGELTQPDEHGAG